MYEFAAVEKTIKVLCFFSFSVSSAHPLRRPGQEPGDVPCPPHPRDHVQVKHLKNTLSEQTLICLCSEGSQLFLVHSCSKNNSANV